MIHFQTFLHNQSLYKIKIKYNEEKSEYNYNREKDHTKI